MDISASDRLVRSTVKLSVEGNDGQLWSGSGLFMFLYIFGPNDDRFSPVVVTNRHVAEGAKRITYRIANESKNEYITTAVPGSAVQFHPSNKIDLAIVPVANEIISSDLKYRREFISSNDIFFGKKLEELNAIESIVMIGYPNGIIDQRGLYPIARKGITATPIYANFDDEPQFMIDCACFPGSSGSPVFLLDQGIFIDKKNTANIGGHRFGLLGFLFAGPTMNQQGEIVAERPPGKLKDMVDVPLMMNLGICVRAECLFDMFPLIREVAKG